jgi:FkbM family methyltransferase
MASKFKHGWFLPNEDEYFEFVLDQYPADKDGKRVYQYHHQDRCMNFLNPSKVRTAIDIGGHIGFWSYYLAKFFKQVHTFEPIISHIECFKKNVLATNVKLHEIGLSNREAKVNFITSHKNSGMSSVDPKSDRINGNINLVSLDSYHFNDVDFIKIDVEGYEKFVIEGARETILRNKPIIIVEEKNNSELFDIPRYSSVSELKNMGLITLERVVDDFIMGW